MLLTQRSLDVALGIALLGVFPLVVFLFPFAESDEHFGEAIFRVDFQGHQDITVPFHESEQLVDFFALEQKLASPGRIVRIAPIPLFIRADVHVVNEGLPLADGGKAVGNVRPARADRFDFGSGEDDARLVRFLDKIVVGSFFILRKRLVKCLLGHQRSLPNMVGSQFYQLREWKASIP